MIQSRRCKSLGQSYHSEPRNVHLTSNSNTSNPAPFHSDFNHTPYTVNYDALTSKRDYDIINHAKFTYTALEKQTHTHIIYTNQHITHIDNNRTRRSHCTKSFLQTLFYVRAHSLSLSLPLARAGPQSLHEYSAHFLQSPPRHTRRVRRMTKNSGVRARIAQNSTEKVAVCSGSSVLLLLLPICALYLDCASALHVKNVKSRSMSRISPRLITLLRY